MGNITHNNSYVKIKVEYSDEFEMSANNIMETTNISKIAFSIALIIPLSLLIWAITSPSRPLISSGTATKTPSII